MKQFKLKILLGGKGLFVLAGPCNIEDYDRTLAIVNEQKEIYANVWCSLYLQASFIDKLIALASLTLLQMDWS